MRRYAKSPAIMHNHQRLCIITIEFGECDKFYKLPYLPLNIDTSELVLMNKINPGILLPNPNPIGVRVWIGVAVGIGIRIGLIFMI